MIKEVVDTAYQRLDIEARIEMGKGSGRTPNRPDDLTKTVLMQQYFRISTG